MIFTLRIVVVFLAFGVLAFLAVAAWMHYGDGQGEKKPGEGLLTWIAVGLAVVNAIVFAVLRMAMTRAARGMYQQGDVQGAMQKYQGATIVWCAGLEGAGFFAGVAFFLEGHVLTLALAGFLALMILFSIPTRGKVDASLE
jgi:hypothetical protein